MKHGYPDVNNYNENVSRNIEHTANSWKQAILYRYEFTDVFEVWCFASLMVFSYYLIVHRVALFLAA